MTISQCWGRLSPRLICFLGHVDQLRRSTLSIPNSWAFCVTNRQQIIEWQKQLLRIFCCSGACISLIDDASWFLLKCLRGDYAGTPRPANLSMIWHSEIPHCPIVFSWVSWGSRNIYTVPETQNWCAAVSFPRHVFGMGDAMYWLEYKVMIGFFMFKSKVLHNGVDVSRAFWAEVVSSKIWTLLSHIGNISVITNSAALTLLMIYLGIDSTFTINSNFQFLWFLSVWKFPTWILLFRVVLAWDRNISRLLRVPAYVVSIPEFGGFHDRTGWVF
jgi:hypothetical protein